MSSTSHTFALNTIEHLSNNSLFYKLTKTVLVGLEDPIEPVTSSNVSNAFPTTSRYNSHYFYSIMINTRAAKRSTTSLGQFQALQYIN